MPSDSLSEEGIVLFLLFSLFFKNCFSELHCAQVFVMMKCHHVVRSQDYGMLMVLLEYLSFKTYGTKTSYEKGKNLLIKVCMSV